MTLPGFTQKISRFPIEIIMRIFMGLSVKGKEKVVGAEASFIIISNHTSKIDGWVVGSSFPFFNYMTYPPTRFMVIKSYMEIPFLELFLRANGSYSIEKWTGKPLEELLAPSFRILGRGQIIQMFPEGKLKKVKPSDYKARPGIACLAKHSGVQILPLAIKREKRKFFFPKFSVTFGSPFYYKDVANNNDDYRVAADKIMQRVRELE
ncbi:1-acyl-sn-glycerol-3-phosphate acyltransferase [bacterium]|nr:MAG: 1-acyl-sn-glycerol-3-phosphate acyltransferase [bacterium]